MITDLRKSVNSILYDRVVSPLSGTFILSWCVINWRILYLIFFSDEEMGLLDKIDYIEENYIHIVPLLVGPLISAIILITIFPIFSIGAFWISRWFYNKQRSIKNKLDGQVTLTLEQSNALILRLREEEKKFLEIISKGEAKDAQIKALEDLVAEKQLEIDNLTKASSKIDSKISRPNVNGMLYHEYLWEDEFNELTKNEVLYNWFGSITEMIHSRKSLNSIDDHVYEYFKSNKIINNDKLNGDFLTEKGSFFKTLLSKKQKEE